MADESLTQQAEEEILKRIVGFAPRVTNAKALLDLAEAYALVTGKVGIRGPQPPANN